MTIPNAYSENTIFHLKKAATELIERLVADLDQWITIRLETNPADPSWAQADAQVQEATVKLDDARTAFAALPETMRPDERFL